MDYEIAIVVVACGAKRLFRNGWPMNRNMRAFHCCCRCGDGDSLSPSLPWRRPLLRLIVARAKSVWPTTAEIRTSVGPLLGWQVGIFSDVFPSLTFTESAVLADALGLASIGGDSGQKVSPEIAMNLDYHLSPDGIAAVKARLAELRLKMLAYRVESIPADDESSRKLFAFAKELGVQTIITGAVPSSLSAVDKLAGETGVNVAIECKGDPKSVMSAIGGLSSHIGVSADFAGWMEQGIQTGRRAGDDQGAADGGATARSQPSRG